MTFINDFLDAFTKVLCMMAPWLLAGFLMSGLISLILTPETIKKHLSGRGIWPVLKATLLGVPLPLCSCGVVPVAAALRKEGAGRGATAAFFISTPQTGVDSIIVTWSLLGWVIGILRPILAFASGIVGGLVISVCDNSDEAAPAADTQVSETAGHCCCCSTTVRPHGVIGCVRHVLKYSFVTMMKTMSISLLTGLFIAALIQQFVPADFGASFVRGNRVLEFLVMIALAIPLYVCSTGSVPIAASLVLKGISPGAALVFLIAGPATNSAMITSMLKILGGKSTILYLAVLTFFALFSGILVNAIGYSWDAATAASSAAMGISVFKRCCGVALMLLLSFGAYSKIKG